MKIDARLENWGRGLGKTFMGEIYDDTKKRFRDGTMIKISRIQSGVLATGQVVKTKNSNYLLGKPAG